MERSWDLTRKALLDLEAFGEGAMKVEDREMIYTYRLLGDAGYIEMKDGPVLGNGYVLFIFVFRLTWQGHDFLNTIREESTWTEVRNSFGNKLLTFSGEILKEVAKAATAVVVKNMMTGGIQ